MDDETDLEQRVKTLEQEAVGLRVGLLVLAIAATRQTGTEEVLRHIETGIVFAGTAMSETAAMPLLTVRQLLTTLTSGEGDPLRGLAAQAALFSQVRPEQRSALNTWIAQAHPEEIAADLKEAIRKILDEPPAAPD